MKSNKKFLQFVAAFLILVFHLWIPITGSGAEMFVVKTGYVGVDIFFFLSAYSLADKEIRYLQLIKNRFITIYAKFVLFVIVAALYKNYTLIKTFKVVTMVDFFEKGGGSFLWFVPAIMLFYLLYPLFVKAQFRYKTLIVLAGWLVLGLALDKLVGYTQIFIFINRIPVIMAGYLLKKYDLKRWIAYICLPAGIALMYLTGYKAKLNVPFREIYFVTGILVVVGIVAISGLVRESALWDVLAAGTLELYGLQMIFGPSLANYIYKMTKSSILTDIIVVVVMFGASIIIAKLFKVIANKTKGERA